MNPVEAYLSELRDIRGSGGGVAETSYYGALAGLLNEVGRGLKPKVRAVSQLRNLGAGAPDFGLFTQPQFARSGDDEPLAGQPPGRGVVEVKGTADDVFDRSRWPDPLQVERYVERYGLVLVTNLRDFVLVGRDSMTGAVTELEACRLAHGEAQFWSRCATPRKFAEEAGEGLTEFLKRVFLAAAPLTDPRDLAWFLASYARTARLRLEQQRELPALSMLRAQLEDALGLEFTGEKGDHFFRSTLVQTLFYGIFAAWVLWSRQHAANNGRGERFEWELASRTLDVPFISALFYQFADPRKLGELRIDEVLDWTEDVLARVDRVVFFQRFREEHAVQYFYEPFLEAFDPQLRKELGVWFTPDEVVRYMVAKVDAVLRDELGIADGLADESVWVLDPCCGTGAYLVEVLRQIDRTLQDNGADALTRQDVKRAAMKRIVGFEILPAPFVIAHLQLGLLLSELGVPLSHVHGEHERAAVYLTNALTGWRDHDAVSAAAVGDKRVHPAQLLFEFEEERDAAAKVKREAPILVVLGNPPYNSFAGTSPAEEDGLVDPYKEGLGHDWGVRKYNLDDLYVRFIRLAERSIAERLGRGVVCLISNFSYLSSGSFVVMRRRLLHAFDAIWIDNLNGDSRETGKVTPQGAPDPSVFSTDRNREGIRVGTAIGLFARRGPKRDLTTVLYRELWGAEKRRQLDADARAPQKIGYEVLRPTADNRYALRPRIVSSEYLSWPSLPELFPRQWGGVQTSRDEFVVDIDKEELRSRIASYYNPAVDDEQMRLLAPSAMAKSDIFDGPQVRRALQHRGAPDQPIHPYFYRPLDCRWVYWDADAGLLNRPRPDYLCHIDTENLWFSAAQRNRKGAFYRPQVSSRLADYHIVESHVGMFPLKVRTDTGGTSRALTPGDGWAHNISQCLGDALVVLGACQDDAFYHALAILHAPLYAHEHIGALKQEWPRVPLPATTESLTASASLGRLVATLLDPDQDSSSLTTSVWRLAVLSSTQGPLDPARHLAVTARWGVAGRGGVTMPSAGKAVERKYSADELDTLSESLATSGVSADGLSQILGETCVDVYLNDVAYWRCVPARVWQYSLGGYPVIKKWLSYRDRVVLGRALTVDEARYVTEMARRIAAILLLEPALDENYGQVKTDTYPWMRLT